MLTTRVMQPEQIATDSGDREADRQSTQVAVGAAVFAVLLAGSALLWVSFGESVYVERILGAIAGCF